MEKRKEKADLKLWELKRGTRVKIGNMIAEFLGVDGMYCRWKVEGSENITIMGHANQKVSEYGEILGHKSELEELKRQNAELKQDLEKARLENENNRMREEIDLLRKGNLPSPGYPYGGGPIFC